MNPKQVVLAMGIFFTGLLIMSLPLWIHQALPLFGNAIDDIQNMVYKLDIAIKSLIIILQK